jgi:hypothetical protein
MKKKLVCRYRYYQNTKIGKNTGTGTSTGTGKSTDDRYFSGTGTSVSVKKKRYKPTASRSREPERGNHRGCPTSQFPPNQTNKRTHAWMCMHQPAHSHSVKNRVNGLRLRASNPRSRLHAQVSLQIATWRRTGVHDFGQFLTLWDVTHVSSWVDDWRMSEWRLTNDDTSIKIQKERIIGDALTSLTVLVTSDELTTSSLKDNYEWPTGDQSSVLQTYDWSIVICK